MTNELYETLNVYADAFQHMREFLNEKERRLFLAETAIRFGYGAGVVLSKGTGVSYSTIRRGVKELLTGERADDGRVRRSGAGHKAAEEIYPDIKGGASFVLLYYGTLAGKAVNQCSGRSESDSFHHNGNRLERRLYAG